MIFDQMGFGWTQAQLDEKRPPLLDGINDRAFREAADYVATAFGYRIDSFESSNDYVLAKRAFESSGRTIEAGQVAAIRNIYRATIAGQERFNFINAWVPDDSMDTGWGYTHEFYQILIEGTPRSKLTWHPETESPMESALIATAMAAVNAIPYVCEASAGVKTTLDLPNMGFTGPLT
jgi:4-hydroxy-tetrahydrodipicolinate reductase